MPHYVFNSSAVFEMGNTKVIAAVYGPREVTSILVIVCTYNLLRGDAFCLSELNYYDFSGPK